MNKGAFTLSFNTSSPQTLDIDILNSLGKVVFERSGISTGSNLHVNLNISDIFPGVYFLKINRQDSHYIKKIIIKY